MTARHLRPRRAAITAGSIADELAPAALEAALDCSIAAEMAAKLRAEAIPGSSLWMLYDAAAIELDRRADIGWQTFAVAMTAPLPLELAA